MLSTIPNALRVVSGLVGQVVAVADDGTLCPSAPQEKSVLRGYRRLDKRCRRKTITTAQARG